MATSPQLTHNGMNGFFPATFERNSTIRRKRNLTTEPVRILVAGSGEVGKTALVVRCLTRKFIGEYSSLDERYSDFKYKYYDVMEGEDMMVEVLDSSCKGSQERFTNTENLRWADAFIMVYAINDRESFDYLEILWNKIQVSRKNNQVPVFLVANKSDLNHRRQVSKEEGQVYSANNGWSFFETSTAEEPDRARQILGEVSRDIWSCKRKTKNFLDRVFGGIVYGLYPASLSTCHG
ncbi:hypothetical protein Ciccas_004370 [Cichlidogyrus casuarinus]|uniref:small monomeric GTPase n=1 Tax=Cichlidogyrus casuarinus TaxID=1844966 RepID=A0ABD2QBN4_9PLAT